MFLRRFYIAIDFDGTLVEHQYPQIGEIKSTTIMKLRERCEELTNIGYFPIIILWTCREGVHLEEAKNWCKLNLPNNLIPTYYNENPEIHQKDVACSKIYADEYWDDKAVRIE